jgi:N-methylhydantoinase B
VVRLEQTGGGGYGDPAARPRELVQQDIEDGYISPEMAATQYGYSFTGATRAIRG